MVPGNSRQGTSEFWLPEIQKNMNWLDFFMKLKIYAPILALPSCNEIKFCYCSESPTFFGTDSPPLILFAIYKGAKE